MRVILAAGLVAAILVVRPSYAAVADDKTCPIDEVVAVIRSVAGDATKTHIKRAHPDAEKDAKDANEAKDAKNEQTLENLLTSTRSPTRALVMAIVSKPVPRRS